MVFPPDFLGIEDKLIRRYDCLDILWCQDTATLEPLTVLYLYNLADKLSHLQLD